MNIRELRRSLKMNKLSIHKRDFGKGYLSLGLVMSGSRYSIIILDVRKSMNHKHSSI